MAAVRTDFLMLPHSATVQLPPSLWQWQHHRLSMTSLDSMNASWPPVQPFLASLGSVFKSVQALECVHGAKRARLSRLRRNVRRL